MTPALEARGLRKAYGPVVAVDDLSFEVHPGEIVGLLGPNGAGKTTALQLCLRLLHPDAGSSRIFGKDPEDLGARRSLGYAPDAPLFPRAMTGMGVLEMHCDLLGVPRERARVVSDRMGLGEAVERPAGTYSRGQQQRLGFSQALLLLDEPTAGMDPAGVARIREILVGLRARGAAVLLNSHLLSEVERICDRVLFVKGGRLLRTHDVRGAGRHVEVRLRNPRHLLAMHPEATLEGDRLRLAIPSEDAVPALIRDLVGEGAEIVEVVLKGAELEELYLKLVEPAG